MDIQNTIIGVVLALICAIPFILFYICKKKQKQTLLNTLNTVAQKHNATITTFEIFNTSIIAIDTVNNLAFYIKNNESTVVNLKQTEHCFLNVKHSNKNVIISADICFKHLSNQEGSFNVYDEAQDPPLNGETIFSKKWVNTFNKHIKIAA